MILRPAPSPPRQPLMISALMMMTFYCGNGDRIPAGAKAVGAEALAPLLAPYPTANQQSVGAASEIFINQTTTLQCNVREYTPGYITTIFLSSFPFVFGCLSESESHYYYSVAFSDLNFPNTPVWVANRYDSVRDLASFVLSPQGPAFLETATGRRLWSSNTDGQHAVGLRLTSQGNLILFDQMNKSLWESFWEPIDLLVPGQVLNQGGMLVAGFSSHAFPTGNFVAVMRKGGLVFYENSSSKALPYYALGYPVISTTMDEIFSSPCNHTRLVLNTTSLTQVQIPDSPACKPPLSSAQRSISFNGPIVLIRLEQNGAFKGYYSDHRPAYDLFKNSSRGACGIPNACGPYGICENSRCRCPGNESMINQLFTLSLEKVYLLNFTSCVPNVPITCLNKGDPEFQYLFDVGVVDFFANDFIEPSMLVDSMDGCKAACHHNCSCRAAFYRRRSKQCFLHDTVMSMMAVSDSDYVGAIKLQRDEPIRGNSKMGFVVGISISTVAVVVLFGLWYYYHKKKKHRRQTLSHDGDDELLACLPGQPKKLSYKELQAATGYFSQKLGVGGFGSVYKGVFPDGSFVAVKQLENAGRFTQGMTEFRNEVIALSNINHQNLVHLRGFCAECEHCLLVYEYVSNGSLDTWLFCTGAARLRPPLDWKTRLAIAVQTARGLVFLHEQCRDRILHLDIKPQNILLDEKFVPKLSDFGLARLINENKESAASRMRGTRGYMAPECLVLAEATEKSDVYSFGMVLLEIVSGRRNVDFSRVAVGESWYFPEFASRKLKEGNVIGIIDKSLLPLSSKDMAEATCVVQVAFWCIQDDPSLRPTIGKTLLMLEGYSEVAQPPLSFHFDLRFHLCTSLTPSTPSPALQFRSEHAEHGDRSDAAQGAAESKGYGDEGDPADTYSAPHSSYISPDSSHHTSPHASPKPAQSSRNSLS